MKYWITFLILMSCFMGLKGEEKFFIVKDNYKGDLGKDNVFVSPANYRHSFIAFSCDKGKYIIVYNTKTMRAKTFEPKLDLSVSRSDENLFFVTFCWDQEKDGAFVIVYSKYGQKLVYYGNTNGPSTLENPGKISEKAIAFNYRDNKLYFVDLLDGNVYIFLPDYSPRLYIKKPGGNLIIRDFKLSPVKGIPYFVLRDSAANDSGIYRGKSFNMVVNNPELDELYPHISDNEKLLGYVEREKQSGKSVICLKTPGMTIKSQKSFALEQNALLQEYSRMYFLGQTLYFYIDAPDIFARKTGKGLSLLSQNKTETILQIRRENNLFNEGDQCINLYNNQQCEYEYVIKEKSILKNIVPLTKNGDVNFLVVMRIKTIIKSSKDIAARGFIDNMTFLSLNDFRSSR